MSDPKVKEFRERLDALCVELGVIFYHEDHQGGGYLELVAEDQTGTCAISIDDEMHKPYVAPQLTAQQLAERAEREALAAESRETWLAGRPKTGPLLPTSSPITVQAPKSAGQTCECFAGSIVCGKRPAGEFMKEGWPDSLILCVNCEADAHGHEPGFTIAHDCNPTDGHTPECRTRSASMDSHRSCSKAPNPTGPMRTNDLRVFHLTGELRAVSREATEHAEARAKLVDELHAVRVLDAWAKKHVSTWAVDDRGGEVVCIGADYTEDLRKGGNRDFEVEGKTPSEARAAAAKALLEEDPTLGDLTNV